MFEELGQLYGIDPAPASATPAVAATPAAKTSDGQSNGLFSLIGALGTAYFGAETAQANAEVAAARNATGTALDSTGRSVSTNTAGQLIPGVDNKMIFIGGGVLLAVGLVVVLMSRGK